MRGLDFEERERGRGGGGGVPSRTVESTSLPTRVSASSAEVWASLPRPGSWSRTVVEAEAASSVVVVRC